MNHPGFGAHLLDWEGGCYAKEVRRADPDEGGPLVQDHVEDYASGYEAIRAIAGRLGMNPVTLRKWLRQAVKWLRQAEVDAGQADGTTSAATREIRELRRKNAELEQTVEILKSATSFFVRASDPQRR